MNKKINIEKITTETVIIPEFSILNLITRKGHQPSICGSLFKECPYMQELSCGDCALSRSNSAEFLKSLFKKENE